MDSAALKANDAMDSAAPKADDEAHDQAVGSIDTTDVTTLTPL